MARSRLVHELLANVTEAQLHGGVAVGAGGLELGNAAGTRLDHGDRDGFACVVEELGHAQFLPKDADGHRTLNKRQQDHLGKGPIWSSLR